MNIHLIDCASAVRKLSCEAIDGSLVFAEDEGCERMRSGRDFFERFIERLVGEDGEDRAEDLVLHNGVVPSNRINYGGVKIASRGIRLSTGDNLLGVDKARQTFYCMRIDYARIVRVRSGVASVEGKESRLCLGYKLAGDRLVHIRVTGRSAPLPTPSHC